MWAHTLCHVKLSGKYKSTTNVHKNLSRPKLARPMAHRRARSCTTDPLSNHLQLYWPNTASSNRWVRVNDHHSPRDIITYETSLVYITKRSEAGLGKATCRLMHLGPEGDIDLEVDQGGFGGGASSTRREVNTKCIYTYTYVYVHRCV